MARLIFPFVLLLLAAPAFAQEAEYGETQFPNSGAPGAQPSFLSGLLMLHSFQYDDARDAFREAQRLDPNFAMAYWGEAMTYNHPIWMEQDREAAQAVLHKLGATLDERLDKAPTAREKDYLRTADVLFFGEGSKEERDDAYAEAMGWLAETHPDDLDAAAFHALAILGTSHEGRDFGTYMRAAAVAENVFDAMPRHPGAAHYLIHAYDDPIHAPLGLRPARVYAEIAPASAHALHMPSHIYFALGMWDEATASNEASYAAAKAHADHMSVPLGGHGFHALTWLFYSYLQQGRYAAARALIDTTWAYHQEENIPRAKSLFLTFLGTYGLETGAWDDDAFGMEIDVSTAGLEARVVDRFARGVAALQRGDEAAAQAALDDLERMLGKREASENKEERILKLELEALLRLHQGDEAAALARMEEATALEDTLPLDFGPPWPTKPSHELFGEILLRLERPIEAQAQFEHALARTPRRIPSLLGLARAATAAGDAAAAHDAYADLAAIWHRADTETPALDEVRAAVASADSN